MSLEAIAAEIEQDVVEGVDGVRAGIIGEIGISKDFTPEEEKVLRGAARAQQATGVPLEVHLPGWERHAGRVLDVVAEEGGDLRKTVLCHMNPSGQDFAYQADFASRESLARIRHDRHGLLLRRPAGPVAFDQENAEAIGRLRDAGLLGSVLISQDVFIKIQLVRYGGTGYAHILDHFVPRLRRHGFTEQDIRMLLVDNPQRVFVGDKQGAEYRWKTDVGGRGVPPWEPTPVTTELTSRVLQAAAPASRGNHRPPPGPRPGPQRQALLHQLRTPSREGECRTSSPTDSSALGAALDRWEPTPPTWPGTPAAPATIPTAISAAGPTSGDVARQRRRPIAHAPWPRRRRQRGDGWTVDPFAAERRHGNVYRARGRRHESGDDRSGRRARNPARRGYPVPRRCPLASVVDEEAGGMGTLAVVDRGYRADGAIIPEFTDLNVAPLCRGILWGRLTIPGRASHIELPQPHWRDGGAVDAIALGRAILDAIDDLNARWADTRPNATRSSLSPARSASPCSTRRVPYRLAGQMRITFDAQYLPAERDERRLGGRVKTELERISPRSPRRTSGCGSIHPRSSGSSTPTAAKRRPIIRPPTPTRAAQAAGAESRMEGMSSHTDMGLLVNAGIPTVNFGPGAPASPTNPTSTLPNAISHSYGRPGANDRRVVRLGR